MPKRRLHLARGGAATLLAAAIAAPALADAPPRRPNIVWIVADDVGYGDLELNEHSSPIATPNLRRLAERGVVFTDGYASAPMCTPSRVGMLTGICPGRMGIYDVTGDAAVSFPRNQKIAPQYFRELGYATAAFGKWHVGGEIKEFAYNYPLERGFERFWGFMGSTHDYFKPAIGAGFNGTGYTSCGYNPIYDGRTPVEKIGYLTDEISRLAVSFIEENKGKPFFLYIPHHANHPPLQVPRDVRKQFEPLGAGENTTTTRAMIAAMDRGIGELLDALDRHKLSNDTLIVYTSDNGGGERAGQLNGPLRGGKFTLLEGGIRVPTVLAWPGHIPGGRVFREPVSNIDFLPTTLAAAGAPPATGVEGTDLLPYLRGERSDAPHGRLCWSNPRHLNDMAIRRGNWKLVRTATGEGLFDLAADPGEMNDRSAGEPALARELAEAWAKWDALNKPSPWTPALQKKYGAPRPTTNFLERGSFRYSGTFGED